MDTNDIANFSEVDSESTHSTFSAWSGVHQRSQASNYDEGSVRNAPNVDNISSALSELNFDENFDDFEDKPVSLPEHSCK